MESITNLIKIKSTPKLKMTPEGDFFRYWVEFLRPIHELTKREMDLLAEFLKVRYELGKVIIDTDTLDRVLMSEETKRNIRTTCGISAKHFQVIMGKFRKNGVIKNNKIHLNLIPTITEEGVGLLVHFSFKDEQHIKLGHH
jgi:predicted transcriptional regulator